MGRFLFDENLSGKLFVFLDREDAGKKLAEFLSPFIDKNTVVLAIPSGGVPVGIEIAKKYHIPFDLILVKKITFPWNTEAGFGAVSIEGDVRLNDEIIHYTGLTQDIINQQKEKTVKTLKRRNILFREEKPFPELKGKKVIIVDDGLASGYTMLTAIDMIKRKNPEEIIVAVPTCSASGVKKVLPYVDKLICLNFREEIPYAVADAYQNWYDLTDEDVLRYLKDFAGEEQKEEQSGN